MYNIYTCSRHNSRWHHHQVFLSLSFSPSVSISLSAFRLFSFAFFLIVLFCLYYYYISVHFINCVQMLYINISILFTISNKANYLCAMSYSFKRLISVSSFRFVLIKKPLIDFPFQNENIKILLPHYFLRTASIENFPYRNPKLRN